jgi:hypothetical protein
MEPNTELFVAWPGRAVYWRSNNRIEAYLLTQTPIGTPKPTVVSWLKPRGKHTILASAPVPPHSDYPSTVVGGTSFISTVVAEYWLPLNTTIEAFYIFDATDNLADVRVRRTIDAP